MFELPQFDTVEEKEAALDRIIQLMEHENGVTLQEYATWPKGKQRRLLRRLIAQDRQRGGVALPPRRSQDAQNDPCVMQRPTSG